MKINNLIFIKSIENILSSNLFLILILFILFFLGITFIRKIIYKISADFKILTHELKREIQSSVQSKFIQLSPEAEVLIQLSIDVWRLEKKIHEVKKQLSDKEKQSFDFSMERIKKQLSKFDIDVKDFTNEKYYEGSNLDVISVVKHKSIKEPVIKETIEPAVLVKGQLVKKAKVILLTN